MSKHATQKLRQRLFEENPHCHWCGVLTINDQHADITPAGKAADRHATLDHLYSKLDGFERYNGANRNKHVLACRLCNNTREAEKHRQMQKTFGNRKFGAHFLYERMLAQIMVAFAKYSTP